MTDDRWLVVGLGNPGDRYAHTRHNVGAEAVHLLADRHGAALKAKRRVRCELAEIATSGRRFALAVPTTYMNLSGGPVQSAAAWFKTPADRVIVCHDDLDLPVGTLRLKRGGGHAGHNGLRDIDRALGTRDYLRVRIGVGRPPGRQPASDHVLRKFPASERDAVDSTLEQAADAVIVLATEGIDTAQNRYNAKS